MRFFSDNAAPVHPDVMAAIAAANEVDTAYDGDRWSGQLDDVMGGIFGCPVKTQWLSTGTAANCLALAAMAQPHQGIICHGEAHIEVDECGAPGLFTGGAKLMLVDGNGAKLTPAAIKEKLASIRDDVHQVQAAAISITNATEYGLVYAPDEISEIAALAREHGLYLHMDGARFANAVASANCHPGDISWRAGVDILSFGFTKNGAMNAEALVFFNHDLAAQAGYRRKRAGHLLSKGRFLAAQILAMAKDDLWLQNARAANKAAAIIADAAGERLLHPVEANEIFIRLTADEAAILRKKGFDFYDWGDGAARLVTSWHHKEADMAPLAEALRNL